MMPFLKSWITSIVMLVIFVTVVEMMVPANKYKKYIDLVIGVLIMITIIKPVFGLLSFGNKNIDSMFNIAEGRFTYDIDNIQKKQNELIIKLYKENLATQISEYIKNKYGLNVNAVNVSLNNDSSIYTLKNISISIAGKESGKITQVKKVVLDSSSMDQKDNVIQNIKKDISVVYNLPIKNISIMEN